ncbi:MAG: Holliday junction resolvase RuvX, partial [Bauldia sp.]|nr:Holliday junction resolvase RuvX [Bauldia sp.]
MAAPAVDQSLEELAAILPAEAALMGLDVGTKTIGLAVSDAGRRIASPLTVIRR